MRTVPLSQLKVDPVLLDDSEIIVSSNWLKKLLKDYQKAVNEVSRLETRCGDLKDLANVRAQQIGDLKDRLVYAETVKSITRLDINA